MKKPYVSEIDQFLKTYDQQHPEKSASQQKEIAKHQRIAQMRDCIKPKEETAPVDDIWKDF